MTVAAVVSRNLSAVESASSTGVDRHYDVAGPDGAPVIVFVHSTRLTRAMWTHQLADLSDTFRVVAVDLPGHGTLVDRPFTLDTAADQVADVIRAVGGGRPAVVVGLSLGGYVAMHLVSRDPSIVRALVLSGSSAEPVSWRAIPFRGLAAVLGGFGPRLDPLGRRFFQARFGPTLAEPIVAGGFWPAGGAVALRSLVGERFGDRLATYDGPTLFLNGAYDLPFRLSATAFARAARHPQRVRLAGATHLANLDRPAAFDAAIRHFVARLDPLA